MLNAHRFWRFCHFLVGFFDVLLSETGFCWRTFISIISKYHDHIKLAYVEKIARPIFSYLVTHHFKGTSFFNFPWLICCVTNNACICLYWDCPQNIPLSLLITAIYGYIVVPCRRRSLYDPQSPMGGCSVLSKNQGKISFS